MKAFIVALFAGIVACESVQPVTAAEAAQWKEKILYSFCSQEHCADGHQPEAGLIEVNGTLYGTTTYGGDAQDGTVFALNPDTGAETVLYSFCNQRGCRDGAGPHAGLVDMNGVLYGTTTFGGRSGPCAIRCGLVFSVDPTTGAETVVYSFCRQDNCTDGDNPAAGVTAVNGTLYGTAEAGGDPNCEGIGCGTLYALDPGNGTQTVLHTFESGWDGYWPEGDLVYEKGKLYGTTALGAPGGVIFGFDLKNGKEKVLYTFCSQTNCADGYEPSAGVIDAKGTLYGTTKYGGTSNWGVVFALDLSTGVETVLHSFQAGTDGAYPQAGLIDLGGTLYGTTSEGGADNHGTVFSVDVATGEETVIHAFQGVGDGAAPLAGLLAVKHKLYGTTSAGGAYGFGTVFMLKQKS